jgi:hypothetical protein
LLACAVALPARADAPPGWTVARGSLQQGKEDGSFILFTDASPSRFSDGELVSPGVLALPLELDVTVRRLGPEAGRSLHFGVVGGVVLIKGGALSLWAYNDPHFSLEGWIPVPGLRTHDEHRVRVVQTQSEVTVFLDGVELRRYRMSAGRPRGRVAIGFKGASGNRSSLLVRRLSVRELEVQK